MEGGGSPEIHCFCRSQDYFPWQKDISLGVCTKADDKGPILPRMSSAMASVPSLRSLLEEKNIFQNFCRRKMLIQVIRCFCIVAEIVCVRVCGHYHQSHKRDKFLMKTVLG
jgi:hypothetical protein